MMLLLSAGLFLVDMLLCVWSVAGEQRNVPNARYVPYNLIMYVYYRKSRNFCVMKFSFEKFRAKIFS